MKPKKFIVHVKADVAYEAIIQANSIKEALEKADGMTHEQLWALPGDVIDAEREITAVIA